jgi:RNA polymerase sigma-70 factor (ECF subfamily)
LRVDPASHTDGRTAHDAPLEGRCAVPVTCFSVKRPRDVRHHAPARELVPAQLVERCRAGDEVAWKELVEATHREVYSLCFRILRNPDDAAEATQDAYLKAWRGLKSFRGDAQFTTWLYRVAANAAITRHRSRARRWDHETKAELEVLQRIPASTSIEETAGARIELETVERGLAQLSEAHRSAIVLRDVYGLTIAEMAKELGISEVAAKVRLHRARKRLRDMVYEQPDMETSA